jgi:saxitoxin biosynthesis operon SxtJ-like protein
VPVSMTPILWRPERKTLAEFSEFWMFFVGMIAAPLAWYRGHTTLAAACWFAAVSVRMVGWLRPEWVRPIYLGLTLATWPIGWVVSHVALALVYYIVITPIGLGLRLAGRDPLKRGFDRDAPTYWEPHNPDRGPERYLRQF